MPHIDRLASTLKVHKYPKEIRKLHYPCHLRSVINCGGRSWFPHAAGIESYKWGSGLQHISYNLWSTGSAVSSIKERMARQYIQRWLWADRSIPGAGELRRPSAQTVFSLDPSR